MSNCVTTDTGLAFVSEVSRIAKLNGIALPVTIDVPYVSLGDALSVTWVVHVRFKGGMELVSGAEADIDSAFELALSRLPARCQKFRLRT